MDPKLMEKMRKVLVLSREGIEGEAQAAAAVLQEMLARHNLAVADLEAKGAAAPAATERAHDLGKAAFRWKLDLADAVAEYYWCLPLVDRARKTVSFVGRPDNVESLGMLYAWLIQQVIAIAAEERGKRDAAAGDRVDPLRWQVNFGVGAVERLGARLGEERARQAEEIARNDLGDVVALAVSRDKENSDYLEERYGYREDGRETRGERERRERREAERRADAEWLTRDPRGYYAAHPDRRPEAVAAEEARSAAYWKAYWAAEGKKERRNSRRRTGPRYREERYDPDEERREEQALEARRAGKSAADRINLRPFIAGEAPRRGELP